MISPFTWTKIPRVPAVFEHVTTPVSILPIATTETLMSLRDEVRQRGLGPDGRLFIRFLSFDRRGDEVRFETGVPTTKPWTNLEPLKYQSGDMPGGFAATTRHCDTYDSIPAALEALRARIRAQGCTPISKPYEFYTESPEDSFDGNYWETELVWFVRRPGSTNAQIVGRAVARSLE